MKDHPIPWRVAYRPRFDSWNEKSQPRIIDANGKTVPISFEQSDDIRHPGSYDEKADMLANMIVAGANKLVMLPMADIDWRVVNS